MIHDDVLLELIIRFLLTGRPIEGQYPVIPEQQVVQKVIVLVYQSVYGIGCIIWRSEKWISEGGSMWTVRSRLQERGLKAFQAANGPRLITHMIENLA